MTLPFTHKDKNPYQWFKLCLLVGGALAILLLVNSVWYYNFIARRVMLDQVRRERCGIAAAQQERNFDAIGRHRSHHGAFDITPAGGIDHGGGAPLGAGRG